MSDKKKVLFLCTGNSCRSQMAEGWAKHLKGEFLDFYSAGIETHGLNPNAVKVMAEAGVDISSQQSENIKKFEEAALDYVVTVCGHAHETCPIFHGDCKVVHVGFRDPPKLARDLEKQGASGEAQLNCYREVRDEIKAYIQSLPDSLLSQGN